MPSVPAPSGERGFTLIELLVVVVVIGILAAIAIPQFLGQTLKAKDASAKSDVRRISQMVEECRLQTADYRGCDSDAELGGTPGLDWGGGPGQSTVWLSSQNSYTVYSVSKAASGGVNHAYFISAQTGTSTIRWCLVDTGTGGGCNSYYW
jgi:type IV pilus assembly protein PilA